MTASASPYEGASAGEDALSIRVFAPEDADAVVTLWRACGLTRAWNDPYRDIARKATAQPELFVVACAGAGAHAPVVGSAMVGFDGHRGWVYYLAVAPGMRRRALGRALMERAEQLLTERGCPKLTLMVRRENATVLAFHRELGYAEDDVVVLGKRLIPDL